MKKLNFNKKEIVDKLLTICSLILGLAMVLSVLGFLIYRNLESLSDANKKINIKKDNKTFLLIPKEESIVSIKPLYNENNNTLFFIIITKDIYNNYKVYKNSELDAKLELVKEAISDEEVRSN